MASFVKYSKACSCGVKLEIQLNRQLVAFVEGAWARLHGGPEHQAVDPSTVKADDMVAELRQFAEAAADAEIPL